MIYEQDLQVGGISKTVNYRGYLFDVGGHRFFTKYGQVQAIWDELLGAEFLARPRLSRIYYRNRYFDHPLKTVGTALANLRLPGESALVVLSQHRRERLKPSRNIVTFEDWVSRQFGMTCFVQYLFQDLYREGLVFSCRQPGA
ncbi:MAG: hypothetical protein MZW92_61480 [Comamonadaceae bacterium]|nr:hypothetical protein [Comamonadaceae bacterium]